jgi:hypothetical protein
MNILFNLNIMIESYDKITTRQGCSLGISEMGKDIRLDWREENLGNRATVSISGQSYPPAGIPDLCVLNMGFNDCGKLVILGGQKEYSYENWIGQETKWRTVYWLRWKKNIHPSPG